MREAAEAAEAGEGRRGLGAYECPEEVKSLPLRVSSNGTEDGATPSNEWGGERQAIGPVAPAVVGSSIVPLTRVLPNLHSVCEAPL